MLTSNVFLGARKHTLKGAGKIRNRIRIGIRFNVTETKEFIKTPDDVSGKNRLRFEVMGHWYSL